VKAKLKFKKPQITLGRRDGKSAKKYRSRGGFLKGRESVEWVVRTKRKEVTIQKTGGTGKKDDKN